MTARFVFDLAAELRKLGYAHANSAKAANPTGTISDVSKISTQGVAETDLPQSIREHFEERAAIREYDGHEPREKAEAEAKAALTVYEYRLTDNPNLWLILIAPGCDLSQAEQALKNRFGIDRVLTVRERPCG